MNRIYKVVKNQSTGSIVVASEFAKGAKKGNKLKLATFALLGMFAHQSFATVSIPQGYDPAINDHKVGHQEVSGTGQIIDLGLADGFASAVKGEEVKRHTITTTDTISSLYKIKYTDVANAKAAYEQALNANLNQSELDNLHNNYLSKQAIADAITDEKFNVNDPNNLIGRNTEGVVITDTTTKYTDPVTDKVFEIKVKDTLVKTEAGSGVGGGNLSVDFYEKTPDEKQYDQMSMINITGNNTDVTVTNSGANQVNGQLNTITKNGSGVITVADGANLTFDTNASYYTGSSKSVSQVFVDKNEYTSSSNTTLYTVKYKGTVNTVLGQRSINSEKDFNDFNKELINYIKKNEQLRLDYSTPEAMQAFYDSQIAGLYTTAPIGSYDVQFTLTKEELAQLAKDQGLENEFNNKVVATDSGTDIGLASVNNNHYIGVTGSGTEITITENANINNAIVNPNGSKNISSGTVIKADFDSSGATGNNIFNIQGTINANNGNAIIAKNAEIYVTDTGYIQGDVSAKGTGIFGDNIVDNSGTITGKVSVENGAVINRDGAKIGSINGGDNLVITNDSGAVIQGNITTGSDGSITNLATVGGSIITGNNTTIINNNNASIAGSITTGQGANITNESGSTIGGGIIAKEGSIVHNENDATVGGTVVIVGNTSSFINDGVVGGSHAADGANSVNNNLIIGSGVVNLNHESSLINNGDIYIGYTYDKSTNQAVVGATNDKQYTAMLISGAGTALVNNKNIYVAGSQQGVNVVSVSNSGQYSDTTSSFISLNHEARVSANIDKDTGNNNKAVVVDGVGSIATIKGKVELNDVGSTGLLVQNGGNITLTGLIDLNSQNINDASGNPDKAVQIRNFGAWAQGENSLFVMDGNAQINMNADRAIGVHIRDGATAEVNDHAGIVFGDKQNQIGFLISGISKASSIKYNSDQELKLKGEGSVLFRVERGSIFNSGTINSTQPSLSVLDSNGTKDSTLMVITNGLAATGANNQTKADLSGFTLKVNGENAKGISIEGGANVKITDNTNIELTGDNSILAKVDGWYYDLNGKNIATQNGKSYLESSANLTTDIASGSGQIVTGQNSIGYYVTHGATLDHKGTVDFKVPSKNNIGVKIDGGGTLISESGSYIKVLGTAIEISGSNSVATVNNVGNGDNPVVWAIGDTGNNSDSAYHVKDQANLQLTGAGMTKAEGTAHGILVDGASKIVLNGSKIDLYGNGTASSTGNGIENRSSLNNIQFINNAGIDVKDGYGIHSSVGFSQNTQTAGIINVYGKGTGIRFENIDSVTGNVLGTTNNTINNTGYEKVIINVFENTGHGIYVDSSKDVHTSASVNIISTTGQSALEIKGSTEKASQSGSLHSANTDAVIVDLNNGHLTNFTNNGELLFGGFTQDVSGNHNFTALSKDQANSSFAINTQASENALVFTNDTQGKINGIVELLGHNPSTGAGNTVILNGEGNIFRTGDGNDAFVVNSVVGDDLGGANQVKQFTKLDGGDGNDQITFDNNSDFSINHDDTIKNIDYVALNNRSQVLLNNLTTSDGLNTGVTTYDIVDAQSQLTYKWNSSNTQFDRLLKGNGALKIDLQNLDNNGHPINEFAFDNTTNTGSFTGVLALTNTKYTLSDSTSHTNTSALTQAHLQALDNSHVTVGAGDQTIKGLTVSGAKIDFGRINLGDEKSTNHIVVDNLVLDRGMIQIDTSGSIYHPGIPFALPLLEQDDGIVFTKLISANNVSGGAINIDVDRSKLKLIDENHNEINDPAQSDLVQNGEIVARATYDTRLSKGTNSDGLYVGYGLTQVELKAKNDASGNGNALILDASSSTPSKAGSSDFDALITDYDNGDGTFSYGDLQIRGNKAVTLSGSNSYHGTTFVKDLSALISGANDALGFTRLLKLDTETKFDLAGWKQSIGSLFTSSSSTVDLNGGELTISGKDGTNTGAPSELSSVIAAGSLMGAGKLIVGDTNLTRTVTSQPSVTIIGDNAGLTAQVINAVNGEINLNAQGGLGSGTLTNNGILNLYFTAQSELTNQLLSGNGVLNKYNSGVLTFTLPQAKDFSGETNIKGGSIIVKGNNNSTSDSYAMSKVTVESTGVLIGLEQAAFQGNINNSGQFFIGELPNSTSVSQHNVTVNNYHGNTGSHLIFNGKLADDNSPINKLVIHGDSSGKSLVTVNNIGGMGAETINGIALIDVNGQSDAEFVQSGRIIAGAYDYKLQRSASNNNNWVLFSTLTARPETGGYIGNLFAANTMFNLRLHDRLGETQYTDLLTGEQKVTSMWMRHQYGYNKYKAANGDLSLKDNWNISQIGGDIAQWSSDELNRLHLGIMVGQGRSKTNVHSNIDSAKADGTVDGYSYGLYATWYDNNQDKTGFYVDSWAIWNNFKASVSGDEFSEKYRLKGLTASVESGYSFLTGELGKYDVWLQPKGQLIWGNVKAKDRIESNGTKVSTNNSNIQTRLGIRASLLSKPEMVAENSIASQVFVEANWLHNSKLYEVTLNDELTVGQDGARNIGELKVGVEGNIVENTDVWFNIAGQRGDHSYENSSVTLGLKYSF